MKGCLPLTRICLLQFHIPSLFFICEYCRQYRLVAHPGDLAQIVERSLSMREVLRLVPQILQTLKAMYLFCSSEAMRGINYDFLMLIF